MIEEDRGGHSDLWNVGGMKRGLEGLYLFRDKVSRKAWPYKLEELRAFCCRVLYNFFCAE